MTEELKAHEEHTLHLKTEYERELAEFEEAQAKADKEREEAEATKDAKEDAEMAASLALAEVSVANQRPKPSSVLTLTPTRMGGIGCQGACRGCRGRGGVRQGDGRGGGSREACR